MSEITINQLEELCEKMRKLDDEIEADKKALSTKNEEYSKMEAQAVQWLDEMKKTSYKSNHGTIIKNDRWRVNLPQTEEDRAAFFNYLKEQGIFEKMITVNSNSLNSYYMKEWEHVKETNPEDALNFSIPGIQEPKVHKTLSFRSK